MSDGEKNIVQKAKEQAEAVKENIENVKQDVESIKKIASKLATGGKLGAAKEAIKMALRNFKTKFKKIILMTIMKLLPFIIAAAILAGIVSAIKDKMVALIGGLSKVGGFFTEAWQWLTNDYWTDISEEFEYVVDAKTGETLGTEESIKQTYVDDTTGYIYDYYGNRHDENGNILNEEGEIRETTKRSYTLVDQYVRELGNNGVSIKELRLLGDANYENYQNIDDLFEDEANKELVEKYIAEFIRADIITQQPHRNRTEEVVNHNNQNLVDGGVYFYRSKKDAEIKDADFDADNYNETTPVDEKDYKLMTYLTPEEFVKELGKEGENISDLVASGEIITTNSKSKGEKLRYSYTIDPKTENMVLLEIKTITTKNTETTDGWFENVANWFKKGSSKETSYELKLVEQDYKSLISKYSMPYEFLINLCEITQNPEFVYHVALLARDTKINLVVQDNIDQIIEVEENEIYNRDQNLNTGEVILDGTERTRKAKVTTTSVPILRTYSADSWSFYEEFEYTKTREGTRTSTGIKENNAEWFEDRTVTMQINVGGADLESGEGLETREYTYKFKCNRRIKTETQTIISKITYNEVTAQSVEKSKQFLGLLISETGECSHDCSNDKVSVRFQPTALECARDAVFDEVKKETGKKVAYRIPNMTITEEPYNKLMSGLELLYAALQSNTTGYEDKGELNTKEQAKDIQQSIENKDYESAYVTKLQGLVEHLRYLMTLPDNEVYNFKDIDGDFDDLDDDDEDDEINVEDIIVKTDEPGAAPEVTRAELVTIINMAFKSSNSARANALSLLDVLMDGQDNCKVNPVFMLALVCQETSMGTANTDYVKIDHNWPSYNLGHTYKDGPESVSTAINGIANGKYYFKQGKYTIKEIGYTYCPNDADHPTQGDNWVQQITSRVKYYYSLIGQEISVGDEAGTYVGTYTSRINGRTYKIYRQQDYPNTKYGSGTISNKGCGVTSDCIVLSAYGRNFNPAQLLNGRTSISIDGELREKGLSATRDKAPSKQKIKNALQQKKTVIVHVNSNSNYTNNEHWMPLVDLKNDNEAYVINPNKYGREGWDSLENIIRGCEEIIIIN